MISVKPFISKCNEHGDILALEKNNLEISKWDTVVEKAQSVLFNQVCNGRKLCYQLP